MKNLMILSVVLLCLSAKGQNLPTAISGETVVIEETVNTDITTNYLIIKSLTLLPKSETEPLVITATASNEWYAKILETTDNMPPSMGENFVRTEVALKEYTDEYLFATAGYTGKQVVFDYSDGLGRVKQTLLANQTLGAKDLVSVKVYNQTTGIEEDLYLPYVKDNVNAGAYDPGFESNPEGYISNFYSGSNGIPNESKPYSHTDYEASPLKRVKSVTGVGSAWHDNDRKVTYAYTVHDGAQTGNDRVRIWRVDDQETLDKEDDLPIARDISDIPRFYLSGELTITEITDEQGNISQSCVDNRGLEIAKRAYNNDQGKWVTTYYVYDDFGRVRFIVPPAVSSKDNSSVSVNEGNGYLFKYIYDSRGRLIKEKSPGSGWVYYCYDKWDRLVLSQDAVQRASPNANSWTFYKYDKHNRLIMTGRKVLNTNPDAWWTNYGKSASTLAENRNAGSSYGYTTNLTLPTSFSEVYSVYYYDDYLFIDYTNWDAEGIDFDYTNDFNIPTENLQVKGLVTGSKVKNLGDNTWLNTVVYYDNDYRQIQVVSENHLGGYDRISSKLSFTGELEESLLTHSKTNAGIDFTYHQRYYYDHGGRLLSIWNNVDNEGEILMATFHYNELGALIEKNIHSTDGGSSFLQSIDYRYNARGWLQSINNPALNNDGSTNNDTNDLFGAKYHYNSSFSVGGTSIPARYDGAMAAFEWKNASVSGKTFDHSITGYLYDDLGQLTKAKYATGNGTSWNLNQGDFDVDVAYEDYNGNIASITRKSGGTTIDALSYTYESGTNKLIQVDDAEDPLRGFKNQTPGVSQYAYSQESGNLTSDLNKEIINIAYNHLQLVDEIEFDDNSRLLYTYDASGNRLSKTFKDSDGNELSRIEYVGLIEYVNGEINQIYTDEGRAYFQNGSFHYEYFITDHQGNNRVAYGVLPYRREMLATFEANRIDQERNDFEISNSYLISESEPDVLNHTPLGSRLVALNGTNANHEVGPATMLNISTGDQVSLEVWAMYDDGASWTSNQIAGFASLVQGVFTGMPGVTSEGASALYTEVSTGGMGLFGSAASQQPSAYLQWVFFDTNYNIVTSNGMTSYEAVGTASDGQYARYAELVTFDRPGYLYVFLANETNQNEDVFFDDFKIIHESPASSFRVTQVNDFYPFGMPMSTSWRDQGYVDPGLMYQSSFASYDSVASTYDFLLRNYDPALGRWWQTDPYNEYHSPYLAMGNLGHLRIDPTGGCNECGDHEAFHWDPVEISGQPWIMNGGYEIEILQYTMSDFSIIGNYQAPEIPTIDVNSISIQPFSLAEAERPSPTVQDIPHSEYLPRNFLNKPLSSFSRSQRLYLISLARKRYVLGQAYFEFWSTAITTLVPLKVPGMGKFFSGLVSYSDDAARGSTQGFKSLGAAAKGFSKNSFKSVNSKLLSKNGITDIHRFKQDFLGRNAVLKHFDVVRHTQSGELLIIRKSTQEIIEYTGTIIR
ncbi:DUF6443 domain-containing protein [Marinoscillum sp.]|uniref:DUF6443 domain-containing protein n=1 Tax=Marinoscillum sp. TaxID=2024838 RepID=UPI003BACACB7